jgi:chorismate mutase
MTTPEQKLADARARIDAIDETLARLLLERIEIVAEVGALKNATWPRDCHIRPGREAKMHRKVVEWFCGTKFSTRAALLIWRQLIGASTALESPLKIAVMSGEHRPRARNYFGANAQITICASLTEVATKLADKTCTIALLPATLPTGWWDCLPADFRIFTQLPILERDMAWLPTLNALAAIDPEPSGDDVSFYVVNGELKTLDGFVPPETANLEGARFLGTSAKPIGAKN